MKPEALAYHNFVQSLRKKTYEDRGFELTRQANRWSLSVSLPESTEKYWASSDLMSVLSKGLEALLALSEQPSTPKEGQLESDITESLSVVAFLESCEQLTEYQPIGLIYTPDPVPSDASTWEVVANIGGASEMFDGLTAMEAIAELQLAL